MKVEFPLTLTRTRPHDHDVEVMVEAELTRVGGAPGSLSVQPVWEVDSCGATDQNGNPADSESDQAQVQEAAEEYAAKHPL